MNNQIQRGNGNGRKILMFSMLIIVGIVILISLVVWLKPFDVEGKIGIMKLEDCGKLTEIDPLCLAIVMKDMNYCEKKSDVESVRLCYAGSYILFAILNNDVSECEKIEDSDRKLVCFAIMKNDTSFCDKLSTEGDICRQILNGEKPSREGEILGEDTYYLIIALRDHNIEFCNNIKNKNDVGICNAILTGDKTYCHKDIQSCYDDVYTKMAFHDNNKSICYNIKRESTRDNCINSFPLNLSK